MKKVTKLNINSLSLGYHMVELKCKKNSGYKLNLVGFSILAEQVLRIDTSSEFLGKNLILKGNWIDTYGKEGYDIVGYKCLLPNYLNLFCYRYYDAAYVPLTTKNADKRGLKVGKKDNVASFYLNEKQFEILLIIPGMQKRQITFYFVDYDNLKRNMEVSIINRETNEILDTQVIENFNNGIYMTYLLKGSIIVRIKKNAGPDAVISGIFFD